MPSLANSYRPKKFKEVIGQKTEVDLLRTIVKDGWRPSAVIFQGPFGCGKTTLARLMARALLCENKTIDEPCGTCTSCQAMDEDNNLAYTEVDAASQGLVDNIRQLKDLISYRVIGSKLKILCLDESHMLSTAAQNALLQTLEEGQEGVVFFFCTTEAHKMLPTIRSRCVHLMLRTLTAAEITDRLRVVCTKEKIEFDDKALRLIGTYVRGHMRDALVLTEQLSKLSTKITEEVTRAYLKLDKRVEVYELLTLSDRKEAMRKLEVLLCEYAVGELADQIGEVLVDAYKVSLGMDDFSQMDTAWLKKVVEAQGTDLLEKAERVLRADTDVATISYGISVVMGALFMESKTAASLETSQAINPPTTFRKPGK